MKKGIILGIIFIAIGFLIGEFIFGNNKEFFKNMESSDTYYFLQEGVYSNKEILQSNLSSLRQKVIDYQNEKYYVYVGITKDLEVAEKLKKIYEEKGYKIYQKEKNVTSKEFSANVEQFDLLIEETSDYDQILTIEEIVLANYEEILKKK